MIYQTIKKLIVIALILFLVSDCKKKEKPLQMQEVSAHVPLALKIKKTEPKLPDFSRGSFPKPDISAPKEHERSFYIQDKKYLSPIINFQFSILHH